MELLTLHHAVFWFGFLILPSRLPSLTHPHPFIPPSAECSGINTSGPKERPVAAGEESRPERADHRRRRHPSVRVKNNNQTDGSWRAVPESTPTNTSSSGLRDPFTAGGRGLWGGPPFVAAKRRNVIQPEIRRDVRVVGGVRYTGPGGGGGFRAGRADGKTAPLTLPNSCHPIRLQKEPPPSNRTAATVTNTDSELIM
ncbi:Hypothetical predicted protein [Xyrichtys novacula]|uniref:Uncharacterized protein n=1 Tax=Xyrichtys novacula TaxID=13765 RepID=A0AAV1FFB1_XYRNO|nr:Hypothetical predicted protein [Xyrichtys novacula]